MHFKKFLNEVKRQETSKQLYHRNVQTFWTFWKQIVFLKKREERTCTKILIEMLEQGDEFYETVNKLKTKNATKATNYVISNWIEVKCDLKNN